ncbi:MAG: DUF512 domain-containing protein [Eubacteriaceae bacterium]
MKKFIIEGIEKNSILEEMEVSPGDILLSINGTKVRDILDYQFLVADNELIVEIEKQNGEIWEVEVDKSIEEDLGVIFNENMLGTKTCKNNCVFCFIDQLPEGMRESLYVKDDDERLSFLTGNYITMTNLSEEAVERIIRYRIMPINLSIHTTNPECRCKMLNNRFAGDVLKYLEQFNENKIQMNGQIVVVPEYNDGEELENTISDLRKFYPVLQSLSVVPVGITKYRENLPKIKGFTREGAKKVLEIVEKNHNEMKALHGNAFVYPSDEFFLMSDIEIPEISYYEDFPQIENGVGMMADFKDSFESNLSMMQQINTEDDGVCEVGILTGVAATDFMHKLLAKFSKKFPHKKISTFPIVNNFFGEAINVTGLITGRDILEQMKNHLEKKPMDYLIVPENMLRKNTTTLLDDWTLEELENELKTKIIKCPVNGEILIKIITSEGK